MKIGTPVRINESESCLDCCQGKRGRIAHKGVHGGWLIHTDHFCPIERTEEELEEVPREVIAEEILAKKEAWIREDYEAQDSDFLREYVPQGDVCAWAVLVLRGEPIE